MQGASCLPCVLSPSVVPAQGSAGWNSALLLRAACPPPAPPLLLPLSLRVPGRRVGRQVGCAPLAWGSSREDRVQEAAQARGGPSAPRARPCPQMSPRALGLLRGAVGPVSREAPRGPELPWGRGPQKGQGAAHALRRPEPQAAASSGGRDAPPSPRGTGPWVSCSPAPHREEGSAGRGRAGTPGLSCSQSGATWWPGAALQGGARQPAVVTGLTRAAVGGQGCPLGPSAASPPH